MATTPEFKPQQRSKTLVCEEVADEVLIYNLETHKALRLNPIASRVWKRCDGKNTIAAIAADLGDGRANHAEEELVHYTVARFRKQSLLESTEVDLPGTVSRRHLIGKLGLMAASVPVITILTAPRAQAAGTLICISHTACMDEGPPVYGNCAKCAENPGVQICTGWCVPGSGSNPGKCNNGMDTPAGC